MLELDLGIRGEAEAGRLRGLVLISERRRRRTREGQRDGRTEAKLDSQKGKKKHNPETESKRRSECEQHINIGR